MRNHEIYILNPFNHEFNHFLGENKNKMRFTNEDKIIIKYLRTKYTQSPLRIMEDHPERNKNWTIGGLKSPGDNQPCNRQLQTPSEESY